MYRIYAQLNKLPYKVSVSSEDYDVNFRFDSPLIYKKKAIELEEDLPQPSNTRQEILKIHPIISDSVMESQDRESMHEEMVPKLKDQQLSIANKINRLNSKGIQHIDNSDCKLYL